MDSNAGTDGDKADDRISRYRLTAFGKLRHEVADTMNTDIVLCSRLFRYGLFDLFKRVGRFGLGLQIADDLCRRNQATPDIGKKLIVILALKMLNKILQTGIMN